jgi:hypothetical protein
MKKLFILFLLLALLTSCATPAVSNTLPQSTGQTSATQPNATEEPTTSEKLSADDIIVPELFNEAVSVTEIWGRPDLDFPYLDKMINSLSDYTYTFEKGLGKDLLWIPFNESWGEFSSFWYGSKLAIDLSQKINIDLTSLNLGATHLHIEFVNKFTAPELYYYNAQTLNQMIKDYSLKESFFESDFRFSDSSRAYLQSRPENKYVYINEGIAYHYTPINRTDSESNLALSYIELVEGNYYLKISFSESFNQEALPEGEFVTKLLTPSTSKEALRGIAVETSAPKANNGASAQEDPYSKFDEGTTGYIFHEEALQKLLLEEESLDGFVEFDPRWGKLKYCMIDYTNGYQFFNLDYRWGEYALEVYSKKLAPKVYEWEKNQIENLKTSFSGDGSDIIHSANKKLDENGWHYSSGVAYHYTDGLLDQIKFISGDYFLHLTRLPACFYSEDGVYTDDYGRGLEEFPDYSEFDNTLNKLIYAHRSLRLYGWLDDHGRYTKLEDSFIADFLDSEKALQKANDFIK